MPSLRDGLSDDVQERAQGYYLHSTRRAMLGLDWSDLTDQQRAPWLKHAAKRIEQERDGD